MTVNNFAFTPADGLRNAVSFPTSPASEADARNQPQTLLDQLRDYINTTIIAELNNKLALTGGSLTGDLSTTGKITATGLLTGSSLVPAGLTGATAASRYAGATVSGAPIGGTFAKGDFVIDQSGAFWVCNTAGTPGTWTKIGGATNTALSASGSYTGDGTNDRLINIGFTPKLVVLSSAMGTGQSHFSLSSATNAAGRLRANGASDTSNTATGGEANRSEAPECTTNGFYVSYLNNAYGPNGSGNAYNYVAIG